MAQRILGLTFLILTLVTLGCADGSSFRSAPVSGETTTSTDDIPPPPQPAGRKTPSAESIAPLAFKDEHTFTKLPGYTVPDKLRARLSKVRPDLVTPKNDSFQVLNQHLKVSVKKKTFTFTGVLRIPGKQDESLEMSCAFDPSEVPWSCADMFPTDIKKAEEKRLQATVNCQDTYKCQDLGVELFVVINGKTKSQLFQSEPFKIRRAESGDRDEDEEYTPPKKAAQQPAYAPPNPPAYKPPVTGYTPPLVNQPALEPATPGYTPPKVLEKPTVEQPSPLQPLPEERQGLQESTSEDEVEYEAEAGEEEINELLTDPNTAAEVTTPMYMPAPKAADRRSIVGIQTLRPSLGNAPTQAVGKHSRGSLQKAATLPKSGTGYKAMSSRVYGTNLMIEMITKVSAAVAVKYPVVVRDLAGPHGGRIGHKSHQTGLDVDIGFPSTTPVSAFYAPCEFGRTSAGKNCLRGRVSGRQLDEAAFWKYLKTFTCTDVKNTGDNGKVVIAIFLDKEIKKHMCEYVRSTGEDMRKGQCAYKALQVLKHESNHHNHIHVRLHCPNRNGACQESTVSLAEGTGC